MFFPLDYYFVIFFDLFPGTIFSTIFSLTSDSERGFPSTSNLMEVGLLSIGGEGESTLIRLTNNESSYD